MTKQRPDRDRPDRSALRAAAAVLAGALAIATGLIWAANSTGQPARHRVVPVVNVGSVPNPQPAKEKSRPSPGDGHHQLATGARLAIAHFTVDAPIVDVAIQNHVMQVPQDPRTLGWWSAGAAPGDGHGSVVIVGHVNYAGVAGALLQLPSARPGDAVTISHGGAISRYSVTAVRTYPKASGLPASLFSSTGPAQLVLITCGGPFDPTTGNYQDNIVAYAMPVN